MVVATALYDGVGKDDGCLSNVVLHDYAMKDSLMANALTIVTLDVLDISIRKGKS